MHKSRISDVTFTITFLQPPGHRCQQLIFSHVCLFVFARFLLKDGQLWLCAPQAKQIWKCLAENAVFLCDREACFKWYCSTSSHFAFGLNSVF